MSTTALITLYLCIFIMFGHLVLFKVSSYRLIIDHITCIYFGLFYYVFFPIIMMSSSYTHLFQNQVPLREFQKLTNEQVEIFLLIFLIILVTIIIAEIRSQKEIIVLPKIGNIDISTMTLFFLLSTIFVIPAFLDMIPLLFSGYDTSLWVRGSRGPFLSYIIILITLSSMYLSLNKKINLLNIFTIFAFIFSLINLFTGNRGFIITFLISIVVIFSESKGGVKIRSIIIMLFLGTIIAAIVASARSSGISSINDGNIMGIIIAQFIAESANVAASLFIYIGQYKPNLIEIPLSFLSQFINIIPSFLFPEKFKYLILDPRVTYYLSSSHFYVMLMVNFGIIGTILFMYCFIRFLNFVKYRLNNIGIYPALCALIPFMFFRDFDLTIVKFMFEFTILLAFMILFFGNSIKRIIKKH